MNTVRRALAYLLLAAALAAVATWGAWYNQDLSFLPLPIKAEQFPLGPALGPLVAAGIIFAIAYVVWPTEDAHSSKGRR